MFAYGSDKPLPTLGTFTARVGCSETNRSCIADFIIVDNSGANLLGKCTAKKQGVLHVGPGVASLLGNDIIASYKPLFTGVGTLKSYRLKLRIDGSIKPVAQPLRRI